MVDGITFADLPAIALGKDPVVDPDAAVASHRRLIHPGARQPTSPNEMAFKSITGANFWHHEFWRN